MSLSIGELMRRVSAEFNAREMGDARREARALVGGVLGLGPEVMLADPERPIATRKAREVLSAARRRACGAPLAYILGRREFWSLAFAVTTDTLVPRPDTETVVETALSLTPHDAPEILDLGTGGGCILLSLLKELPNARGVGLDVSAAALAVARDNARAHALAARADFIEADFTEAPDGPFDLVVANPPYIPTRDIEGLSVDVRDHEPRLALDGGDDGLDAYRVIAPLLDRLLAANGAAVFEVGLGQAAEVAGIFEAARLTVLPPRRDLAGIARCLIAKKP